MVSPASIEYELTKLIKKREAEMDKELKPLANWIDKKYNANTMNIIYDTIDNNTRPRLNIIFEKLAEAEKFKTKFGFDEIKQQEIASQFRQTLIFQGLAIKKRFWNFFSSEESAQYKTENTLVIFSAIEPIAKIEAFWKITKEEFQIFKSQLNQEHLWEIHPGTYDKPTFFFYTEKQANQYANNEMKSILSEKYFELVKRYDDFDYFILEEFSIVIDSKENLDQNYDGDWFNYDRK